MFGNLLFLILVLLLINFTFEVPVEPWISSPALGLLGGLLLYVFVIGLIYLQNLLFRKRSKAAQLVVANLELITFLACYHFIFGANRIFALPSQALVTFTSLLLYMGGLWVFHYSNSSSKKESPCVEAFWELRMIIPFTLPFLIFTVITDLLQFYPSDALFHPSNDDLLTSIVLFAASVAFLIVMMIFLPPLIQWIWKCQPLQNIELKKRLETFCTKAQFSHAGMRTWTIMERNMTAAIIGIVPRFRYVMFTNRLLEKLAPEEVEAVLAHEIGHSKHKHLILYPFVIFGMLVCVGFFSLFFAEPLAHTLLLRNFLTPSPVWNILFPLIIFIAYALIIALYFRLVFGFFSRRFERQADLHVFSYFSSPQPLIDALKHVAFGSGIPLTDPSWHHYSIQKRVDFLQAADQNRTLISRHSRKVKRDFLIYCAVLLLSIGILISPSFSQIIPFKQISAGIALSTQKIDSSLNGKLRLFIVENQMKKYYLSGEPTKEALIQSYSTEAGLTVPGIAEFLSAHQLINEKQVQSAATLMSYAWQTFDFSMATPQLLNEFEHTTTQILDLAKQSPYTDETKKLQNARQKKLGKTPMKTTQNYQAYFQQYREQIQEDYFTFLRFPSISSEPQNAEDCRACANWLKDYLEEAGFTVELWETSGHPTIYATHMNAGPDKPTLLIYNHYDVQPVDPLEEWDSPPFEPTIRDGSVFARGAQDNKGQCFYVIQALKAMLKEEGSFPVNVKLCIEGEEEFASTGLSGILPTKKKELNADHLVIVDVGIEALDKPGITLGCRGLATMDLEVTGSNTDLHSGSHGGVVYNPIHALTEIIAKLRDAKGKITVPGFYDDIVELTDDEKQLIAFNFDTDDYHKQFDTLPHGGENHLSPTERKWIRPTLEINGIAGGYAGKGFKTVIPAKAKAKISCRLVPNQDPQKVASRVSEYIKSIAPKGVQVSVNIHKGMGKSLRASPHAKVAKSFAAAYETVFHKKCDYILQGGSIPIISELADASQAEVVLMGLGLAGDKIHAPNEHFDMDRFQTGFLIITEALHQLGDSTR